MIDPCGPFVLLDDAREAGPAPARLYSGPAEIIKTRDPEEVRHCFDRLREAQGRGLHAAGFLSYEAGPAFEARLAPLRRPSLEGAPPLLWFGLFDQAEEIDATRIPDRLPDPMSAWAGPPRPLIERGAYEAAVGRVKAHIVAGDIYQANLTFPAEVPIAGDPLALFANIRRRARAGHGGIVFTGEHWLLSFSPELFFSVKNGAVTTRPMKGTAKRRQVAAEDRAAVAALREDAKQRAENLMIVDLLRNDLSRVSRLFEVETYPTVHQMTSTVVSQLEEGVGPVDLLGAIFPCGSITGAPKIRAMEIIAGLERRPRHVYTGAIGRVAPEGEASFNVAIRTISLKVGESAI